MSKAENALGCISKGFKEFIERIEVDERLSELEEYLPSKSDSEQYRWTIDKAKIVLELLKVRDHDTEDTILSCILREQHGWQGDRYHLYNRCLNCGNHCKNTRWLTNSSSVEAKLMVMKTLFVNNEVSKVTSYLFGYCLAALFTSRLGRDDLRVPYYLQIACERNSNVYKLIHDIVHICDVNTGLGEFCNVGEGVCEYDHMTVFPLPSGEKILEGLTKARDIPVVIDGYENEKYYGTWLREVANLSGKTRSSSLKYQFNALPIFLCDSIKSQYRNVLNMDLTELEVEDEYLMVLQENKGILASVALDLIITANEHVFKELTRYEKIRNSFTEERHFFNNINSHINKIRREYDVRRFAATDVTNIGILSYFLKKYLNVFERSIKLSADERRLLQTDFHTLVMLLEKDIKSSLLAIHRNNSPVTPTTVNIDVSDIDTDAAPKIKKKGEKYAKDIVKYYQSYGVGIVLPEAEYKNERFIFSVKLLPGTNRKKVYLHAEDVRCLLEIETFHVEKNKISPKIIVSEKSFNGNSLSKILESDEFRHSNLELPYAVGYDVMGDMVIADIAEFPHLLIGGTSGSGKSSAIHSLLMSIVTGQPAEKVKLLLIDFGSSDLNIYESTPHMLVPAIKTHEIEKGRQYILWLQRLMEERLKKKDSVGVKNEKEELARWPYIICVIDEFPAFVSQLNAGKGNKDSHKIIEDILARARKVKIHLVLSAQDATKESICIKNTNLGAGIAFRCTNWRDSKAIIDDTVATELSGIGSMYFKYVHFEGLKRMQGAHMDWIEDIPRELNRLKGKYRQPDRIYENIELPFIQGADGVEIVQSFSATNKDAETNMDSDEDILLEIVEWLSDTNANKLSNNNLKKKFECGYDRAQGFMDMLESHEIIDAQKGKLPRNVFQDKVAAYLEKYNCSENESGENGDQRIGELQGDDATTVDVEPQDNKQGAVDSALPEKQVTVFDGRNRQKVTDGLKKFIEVNNIKQVDKNKSQKVSQGSKKR